jgi:hypothetical protein
MALLDGNLPSDCAELNYGSGFTTNLYGNSNLVLVNRTDGKILRTIDLKVAGRPIAVMSGPASSLWGRFAILVLSSSSPQLTLVNPFVPSQFKLTQKEYDRLLDSLAEYRKKVFQRLVGPANTDGSFTPKGPVKKGLISRQITLKLEGIAIDGTISKLVTWDKEIIVETRDGDSYLLDLNAPDWLFQFSDLTVTVKKHSPEAEFNHESVRLLKLKFEQLQQRGHGLHERHEKLASRVKKLYGKLVAHPELANLKKKTIELGARLRMCLGAPSGSSDKHFEVELRRLQREFAEMQGARASSRNPHDFVDFKLKPV